MTDHPTLAGGPLSGAGPVDQWPRLAALRARIEAEPAVIDAIATGPGDTPAGSGACRGRITLAEVVGRFGI